MMCRALESTIWFASVNYALERASVRFEPSVSTSDRSMSFI